MTDTLTEMTETAKRLADENATLRAVLDAAESLTMLISKGWTFGNELESTRTAIEKFHELFPQSSTSVLLTVEIPLLHDAAPEDIKAFVTEAISIYGRSLRPPGGHNRQDAGDLLFDPKGVIVTIQPEEQIDESPF